MMGGAVCSPCSVCGRLNFLARQPVAGLSSGVLKWLKFLAGLGLLPVCYAAVEVLIRVLRLSGQMQSFWIVFAAGAACWVVMFLMLPRPMWLYVAGHELTHAVWTWMFGGRVRKIHISSKGGHVVITRNNFLISLAPYFFPFYAAVTVAVFAAGHLIWGWSRYQPLFHLLLGAAYAFHVTLTLQILQTRQSDLQQHGWFFSMVIIFLGNAAVLLAGIPLLTAAVEIDAVFVEWFQRAMDVWKWVFGWWKAIAARS